MDRDTVQLKQAMVELAHNPAFARVRSHIERLRDEAASTAATAHEDIIVRQAQGAYAAHDKFLRELANARSVLEKYHAKA